VGRICGSGGNEEPWGGGSRRAACSTVMQAVIFDLDGTLLDTLEDIAAAANSALREEGFPEHPLDAYRRFVGNGVAILMQRALPESNLQPEQIERCAERFRDVYRDHWNLRTQLYPGINELLSELRARHLQLGVLSNKPHEFTLQCVTTYFPTDWFTCVFGQREGIPHKPDPAGVHEILDHMQVAPEHCLFVGDSAVDMQTARGAGLTAIGVSWGFRSRDELLEHGAARIIDHPHELLALVGARNDLPPKGRGAGVAR
jgi:phosphoglycolate phosphatase